MTTIVTTTGVVSIPARVIKGIALLNRRVPGWAMLVNPDRLDQHSLADSILGHLYGDSVEGCAVLGLTEAAEIAHGFWPDPSATGNGQPTPPQEAFAELTGYWQVAIGAHRTGGDC